MTNEEAKTMARAVIKKLNHYIQPNQSSDPLLSTPLYELDVMTVALALNQAELMGLHSLASLFSDSVETCDGLVTGPQEKS